MKLSYSLIQYHLQKTNSHCFLNRQLGRKIPDNPAFELGRKIHQKIQSNLSNYIDLKGFVVETKDFDENTHFEFEYKGYTIHGYLDGLNKESGAMLEIKSGTHFLSIGDFFRNPQIGIYALAFPKFTKAICITALSDETQWQGQPPKVFEFALTDGIKKNAERFIDEAIEILKEGKFQGGLTDGKCLGWCSYQNNCFFR